jgi:hypothetical protein
LKQVNVDKTIEEMVEKFETCQKRWNCVKELALDPGQILIKKKTCSMAGLNNGKDIRKVLDQLVTERQETKINVHMLLG